MRNFFELLLSLLLPESGEQTRRILSSHRFAPMYMLMYQIFRLIVNIKASSTRLSMYAAHSHFLSFRGKTKQTLTLESSFVFSPYSAQSTQLCLSTVVPRLPTVSNSCNWSLFVESEHSTCVPMKFWLNPKLIISVKHSRIRFNNNFFKEFPDQVFLIK